MTRHSISYAKLARLARVAPSSYRQSSIAPSLHLPHRRRDAFSAPTLARLRSPHALDAHGPGPGSDSRPRRRADQPSDHGPVGRAGPLWAGPRPDRCWSHGRRSPNPSPVPARPVAPTLAGAVADALLVQLGVTMRCGGRLHPLPGVLGLR